MSEQRHQGDSPGEFFVRTAHAASMRMNGDRDFIVEEVTHHIDRMLSEKIAQGVADGVRQIVSDPEFMSNFWSQGYAQLSENASVGLKLWIGGRILIIFLGVVFTAAMGWMYSKGSFK